MIKESWLIFRSADHFLSGVLKEGFGHVNFLTKVDDVWIELSPDHHRLLVDLFPGINDKDIPSLLVRAGYRIFKIKYDVDIKSKFFPRILIGFSCVSFVKYALGYKDYSVTPYGLCKNLKKCKKNIISFEEI